MKASDKSTANLSKLTGSKLQTGNEKPKLTEPSCKDGVCTINWKPLRPAASA